MKTLAVMCIAFTKAKLLHTAVYRDRQDKNANFEEHHTCRNRRQGC
jgi:hypothetical protein